MDIPRLAAFAAFSLALLPAAAQAEERGDWALQVTPYVWATGIGGDIRPFSGAPTLSIDRSFAEVLEDLDAAFFVSGFARYERFVLLGDVSYSESSRKGLVPPGLAAKGDLTQMSLTLAAGYRVVDNPDLTVDLLAGARHWQVEGSVKVPLLGVSASPELDFTDPIVAVRASLALAPQWSTTLYADFGGFGIGSEQTSQIAATLNYQATENIFLSAGYRLLNLDYRDGGTRIDMTMSGPLLGATWKF